MPHVVFCLRTTRHRGRQNYVFSSPSETRSTCEVMATRYLNAKLVTAIPSKCTSRPFSDRSHKGQMGWHCTNQQSGLSIRVFHFERQFVRAYHGPNKRKHGGTIEFQCDRSCFGQCSRYLRQWVIIYYTKQSTSSWTCGAHHGTRIIVAGDNFHLPERRAAFLHSVIKGSRIPGGHTEPNHFSSCWASSSE